MIKEIELLARDRLLRGDGGPKCRFDEVSQFSSLVFLNAANFISSLFTPICNCYTDNIKHGCILLIINDRSINRVIIYVYII